MPARPDGDKKWTSQAADKVLAALNRADELGGELRDYLQDRMANDPRVANARRTVARWFGRAPAAAPGGDRPGAAAGGGGATPTPVVQCTVPTLVGVRLNTAYVLWINAGFTGTWTENISGNGTIGTQSLPANSKADCSSGITVGP